MSEPSQLTTSSHQRALLERQEVGLGQEVAGNNRKWLLTFPSLVCADGPAH